MTSSQTNAASLPEIRAFILERLASELGLRPQDIDPQQPFDEYGLDSVNATMIAGDLEVWLDRKLSGSLLFECPTVDSLAKFLSAPPSTATSAPASDEGRESGVLGAILGGERLRFSERLERIAAFRASLPPEAYLRLLDAATEREVTVLDPSTGERRTMLMFGCNDYLGLAKDPRVIARANQAAARFGVGLGGPAVLNGYTVLHRQLEQKLSAFKHAEDTIVFPTGYSANVGLLTALPVRGDTIFLDEYAHASIHDGVRMGQARVVSFPHNDVDGLERALAGRAGGDAFVVVEGVYSMDGDLAPLDRLVPACERHGAILVLDDAHGTGVIGEGGRGSASHFGMQGRVPIQLGTFSKALGGIGGFVSASKPIIDALRCLSRSYIFSATLPPMIVAAVLAALEILEEEPWRISRLHENVRYAQESLQRVGIPVEPKAAILALLARPGMDIRAAARDFHDAGIFVNPAEYPAVPKHQERIRASVMSTHTKADIDRLVQCAERVWAPYPKR